MQSSDFMLHIAADERNFSLRKEGGTATVIRRNFGFRPRTPPAKMVSAILANGRAPALRDHLSQGQMNQALSWWLVGSLVRASHEQGSGLAIEGSVLHAIWTALPEHSRALFPEHVANAIDALKDKNFPLTNPPSRLSDALLLGGDFVRWLTTDQGASENG